MQVVLGDLVEPLGRDTAAAGDVLQERRHLLGALGPAEGQQQDGVKVSSTPYSNWVLAPPSA